MRRRDAILSKGMVGVPPLENGSLKGVALHLDQMASDYYALLDWDMETSMLSRKSLERISLDKIYGSKGNQ